MDFIDLVFKSALVIVLVILLLVVFRMIVDMVFEKDEDSFE